jgi:hypothetical protein
MVFEELAQDNPNATRDVANARLACRLLGNPGEPYLYRRLNFFLDLTSVKKLVKISKEPNKARQVRTVVFETVALATPKDMTQEEMDDSILRTPLEVWLYEQYSFRTNANTMRNVRKAMKQFNNLESLVHTSGFGTLRPGHNAGHSLEDVINQVGHLQDGELRLLRKLLWMNRGSDRIYKAPGPTHLNTVDLSAEFFAGMLVDALSSNSKLSEISSSTHASQTFLPVIDEDELDIFSKKNLVVPINENMQSLKFELLGYNRHSRDETEDRGDGEHLPDIIDLGIFLPNITRLHLAGASFGKRLDLSTFPYRVPYDSIGDNDPKWENLKTITFSFVGISIKTLKWTTNQNASINLDNVVYQGNSFEGHNYSFDGHIFEGHTFEGSQSLNAKEMNFSGFQVFRWIVGADEVWMIGATANEADVARDQYEQIFPFGTPLSRPEPLPIWPFEMEEYLFKKGPSPFHEGNLWGHCDIDQLDVPNPEWKKSATIMHSIHKGRKWWQQAEAEDASLLY